MAGKSTIGKRATPFSQASISNRTVGSRTSYGKIVYFHYDKQNFGTPTNVQSAGAAATIAKNAFAITQGVIENEISELRTSKSIAAPSGTFEISLFPTQNWKSTISPGDWMVIYMFDKYKVKQGLLDSKALNTTNMIMLGNIDRVARSLQKDKESDKVVLKYVVSGRNFGKVFEDCDIWFDPYVTQAQTLDVALTTAGLEITGDPSTMVNQVLDVFLGPGGKFPKGSTKPLSQWQIPKELSKLFGASDFSVSSSKPVFYDILDNQVKTGLPGFKTRQMLTVSSNGSVWDMIQRSSNNLVNEVFLEEVRAADGSVTPTIVMRPRPIQTPGFTATSPSFSQFGKEDGAVRGALKGAFQSLQDLATKSFIEISQAEIIYEDIGKDDHSRFNMFWLNTTQNYEFFASHMSNLAKKGIANPTFSRPPIQRYGLKRLEQTLEFCYNKGSAGADQGPAPNLLLYKAFMTQIYDMNYANHLYDCGTIQCTGVLEAELGKALIILKDKSLKTSKSKLFYIEGYEHQWKFPGKWTTTFTITHGQFLDETKTGDIFIDVLDPTDFGSEDVLIDNTYLAKVNSGKS